MKHVRDVALRVSHTTFVLLVSVVLVALVTVGCGSSMGPQSGVVSFSDGSPVVSGSIELRRSTDQQRFAGRIEPDGTFRPAREDGAVGVPPGVYDVVVVQVVLTEDLALEDHTHGHSVPRRYADYNTSGLQVEIQPGDTAPIEIVIEVPGQ